MWTKVHGISVVPKTTRVVSVCVYKVIERVLFYTFVTGNEPKTRSLRFKMVINCVIFPFGKQ